MPISVKTTAKSKAGNIVIPASASVGDLFLIGCGSYNGYWSFPGAVTPIGSYTNFGTGTYNTYLSVGYLIVGSGQAGTTITFTNNGGDSSYTSTVGILITGHDPVSPILANNFNASTANQTTCGTQSVTSITAKAMGFYFMAQMNTGGVTPTWSSISGHSSVDSEICNQNVYQGTIAYKDAAASNPGSTIGISAATVPNSSNIGRVIAIKEGNVTPTITSQSPSNYDAIGLVTSPTTVSWTYSDPESNTQYKYEISYRVAGTTGAYTTVTSANAVTTTSHTFAANTFSDGIEYEWRVRIDDNQGGGWSSYSTAYFTAGKSKWTYGPPVSTSSSTSVATTRTFASYNFDSGTQGWSNNNFFGTYTDCTFASTTTRPKTGTNSLEITWPTANLSRVVSPQISGFQIGRRYRARADIYVPAGSPIVYLDPFLQSSGTGAAVGGILDKDVWISALSEFTAANADIYFAIYAANTTSGTKAFVDNVVIESLPIDSGSYQLSVRTSDVEGFGPWSAGANMTVNTPPIDYDINLTPMRVGGNINVAWDYSDINIQPQTKYKIRYRKKT